MSRPHRYHKEFACVVQHGCICCQPVFAILNEPTFIPTRWLTTCFCLAAETELITGSMPGRSLTQANQPAGEPTTQFYPMRKLGRQQAACSVLSVTSYSFQVALLGRSQAISLPAALHLSKAR